MAVVLFDGQPASTKALEFALVPGTFFNHETEQLIIVNGWKESKDVAALGAPGQAIDIIGKSRVAQNTLNYKIEMMKLTSLSDISTTANTPVPPSAAPTPTPGEGSPGKSGTAKSDSRKTPADAKKKGGAPEPVAEAAEPAEPAVPEKSPQQLAEAIATYVVERASHHHCPHLVLGVGNSMQGKQISVGSVARQIVASYRSSLRIFCMKATGPAVRPTAALRMLVLVVPGAPLTHLEEALTKHAHVADKGDRVGVVIINNNGKPKPPTDVISVASHDERGLPQAQEVARECTAILAKHGLSDAPQGEEGAQSTVVAETFPLINFVTLEPTNAVPLPTVDDSVGATQLAKFVAAIKVDFLVVPPKTVIEVKDEQPPTEEGEEEGEEGNTGIATDSAPTTTTITVCGETLVQTLMASPKPHLLFM